MNTTKFSREIAKLEKKDIIILIALTFTFILLNISVINDVIIKILGLVLRRNIDPGNGAYVLFNFLYIPISLLIVYFISFLLIKRYAVKKTAVFIIDIFFFWFISNHYIRKVGNFIGYWTSWDNGDFVRSIKRGYGKNTLYGTNYPPLAVLLFRWLHQFLLNDDGTISEDAAIYITNMFIVIIVLSLSYLLYCLITPQKGSFFYIISFFFTSSMLFCFGRMNIMFLALIFTFIFLLQYKNENRTIQICSFVALAIAANIKYFPAIFGLLLLKEKRWKDCIICALLGLSLFLLPMAIPKDSVLYTNMYDSEVATDQGVSQVTDDTTSTGAIESAYDAVSSFADLKKAKGDSLSIASSVYNILHALKVEDNTIFPIEYIAIVLNSIIMIALFFITQRYDFELAILGLFPIMLITTSNWYFTIFLIPAFLEFMKRKNSCNEDILLFIIFIHLFSYRWGFMGAFRIQDWKTTLLLWIFIAVSIIREFISKRRMEESIQT